MTTMTHSEIIKEHAFTAGLTDSQVAKLSEFAHEVSFKDNEVILEAGQQSKNFYLLLSGGVRGSGGRDPTRYASRLWAPAMHSAGPRC